MVAALDLVGDPGRIHEEGMTVRVAVEQAREVVAATFGARAREVVFTGSGTEAIATVVQGVAGRGGHQVVTAVEHSAVRLAAERARRRDRGRRRRPGPGRPRRRRRRPPSRHRRRPRAGREPRGRDAPAGRRGDRRLRRPRGAGPRRRRAGQRARPGRLRRRWVPTSCRSAPTSSVGPPASGRCSCDAACGSIPSSSAATRNGPGAPAWRTPRRWSASPPPVQALRLDDEAAEARRLTDRVLAGVVEPRRGADLR